MANMAIGDVSLLGTNHSYNSFTYYGATGMTEEDAGKPAALSAANTVKVAEDGDVIIGYIEQVENRELEGIITVTVTHIGFFKFNLKAEDTVALGDSIVGAGNGEVKKSTAARQDNFVVEVGSDYVVARICK